LLGLSHAGQLWQTIAGAGEHLYTLKFSRSEEDQADAGGLQNMAEAGFNLHGMLDLFNTLQQATGGKSGGPEFLSDHPLTTARIKHTEQRIAQMEAKDPGLRNNS
jgi:predicted Zn-dependent protease